MKITIVGAGIGGLATAWALVKSGHEVTVLEQGPIPNPLAASGDHHRIIRRAYGAAAGYGRLITEAYDAWDELWADLGESHLDPRGFLCLSREEGDEAEQMRDGLAAGGYPFDVLSSAQAAVEWPFLDRETVRYAYFSPEGGALHCRRIALGLAAWLRAHGADVRENTKVLAVRPETAAVELASGEHLLADQVVVTAGAWVLNLFPDLADTLKTYRTAVVYLDPPAVLRSAWERAPVILDVGGKTGGWIIPPTGGAGLKFGSDLHRVRTSDADWNREPVEGEGEAIRDLFAPPLVAIGEYRVAQVVTCAYTFTGDETFFAERRDKCVIVSACSGHGYKFGAAVGRRVARGLEATSMETLTTWLRAEAA